MPEDAGTILQAAVNRLLGGAMMAPATHLHRKKLIHSFSAWVADCRKTIGNPSIDIGGVNSAPLVIRERKTLSQRKQFIASADRATL